MIKMKCFLTKNYESDQTRQFYYGGACGHEADTSGIVVEAKVFVSYAMELW